MPRLPPRFAAVILTFASLFLQRSWRHAKVLLTGAILAPGQRTVTSILRIAGLARERRFVNYHRVLNRAAWCPRAAARLLLSLLLAAFVPSGPVVLGIDDTIERRRGKRIAAKGIYRDPVRSSRGHFVKASGLRWLSLMLLAPVPWAQRVWALPFLTALAPSERYCQTRGRRHKTLTDWGRQLVLQVRRWLPGRELVVVAGQRLRRLGVPGRRQPPPRGRHHAPAARRRPLRATATPPARNGWAPSNKRQARGEPVRCAGRPGHGLAARHRAGLVWRRRARHRDQHQHRRLAPWRDAHRSDPLGADPRPSRQVRPASPALHQSGPGPRPGPALVRPAMAGRSHVQGSA